MSDLQWDESIDYLPKKIEIFNNPENVRIVRRESPDNEEDNRAVLRVSYKPLWDKEENLEKIMIVVEDITYIEVQEVMKKRQDEDSYNKTLSELAPQQR